MSHLRIITDLAQGFTTSYHRFLNVPIPRLRLRTVLIGLAFWLAFAYLAAGEYGVMR